jgi:NADH-quinone oxidoreductase subunit J
VAGVFIFLGSEFLAMMEILIYVGAICIAIVFAIMLSQPMHLQIPKRYRPKLVFSFVVAAAIFFSFHGIVTLTDWEPALVRGGDWGVARLGQLLFTRYELLFELISLVLLVAIMGAIITAAALAGEESGENGKEA